MSSSENGAEIRVGRHDYPIVLGSDSAMASSAHLCIPSDRVSTTSNPAAARIAGRCR
ncbi:protein of unknown function [Micropruina glycogenica]|uniref:Uncharacterized protein n=1 Tax=Micropruina glycogenica TaxID=75385 RepID=A0A2N9JLX1_9ACTN|nr:protein of unknown function [Micropruina glycogenica]